MNTLLQYVRAAGLLALVSGVVLPSIAQAIPAGQRDVELVEVSTSSESFVLVPNTSVTVNNGATARNCVIQFSADALNDQVNDHVNVAFAIGSSNVSAASCSAVGGPEFFYTSSVPLINTATTVHVRNVGTGINTIKACYRLVDEPGDGGTASLLQRALTVECRTQ